MQNLDQLRAAHAVKRARTLKKRSVNKLPAMILSNGLLATAAFTKDGNREGMRDAMDAVADYLGSRNLIGPGKVGCDGMINDLVSRSSIDLQRATSEALAYLSFLKRFAVEERT